MRYGSVCSGIEAASMAWEPLGWTPEFFSEIEPFPCAVLAHHYGSNLPGKPVGNGVPNHGDMTKFKDWPDHAIDLLVGGTPCQSFSVAGLRAGLADPRGNLMLTYLAVAAKYQPRWLLWENVPGVLSSAGGRDFGSFLGGLGELGYGFAYRVLDAQFCRALGYAGAVPQRRRRVFLVGYLGDWRCAAAVLFDAASLRGDSAPRREAGQGIAAPITAGSPGGSGYRLDPDTSENLVAFGGNDTRGPISAATARNGHGGPVGRLDFESETFVVAPVAASLTRGAESAGKGGYAGRRQEDDVNIIAFDTTQITSATNRNNPQSGDPCHPLAAGAHPPAIAFAQITETMYGISHADAQKTYADEALRALRETVGAEAYSEWGLGVVAALWPPEILRPEVYGGGIRRKADDWNVVVGNTRSGSAVGAAWSVQQVWEAGCVGRAPQGWQPSERLAAELGAHLSELPHQRASAARFLLGLWRTGEGLGLLREALSALQKVWRSDDHEDQPAQPRWAVRRLTPLEACRLQGFPDDYFEGVTYRGKKPADGPIYKALGNSMAIPPMRVIGARIAMVDARPIPSHGEGR